MTFLEISGLTLIGVVFVVALYALFRRDRILNSGRSKVFVAGSMSILIVGLALLVGPAFFNN